MSFKQKPTVVEPLYYGKLYIDTESLDFTNFDLDNNSQDLLQSLVDEFNLSKVESNEILWLQDFKNFCKGSKDLNSSLKEEIKSNFWAWNYLTITITKKYERPFLKK